MPAEIDSTREAPGLLESVSRYRVTVAVVALSLAALGALSGLVLASPSATARVALVDARGTELLGGSTGGDSQARYAAQQARFAGSDAVLAAVPDVSDVDLDVAALRTRVTTRAAPDADVVAVTATGPDTAQAVAVADAVAAAYMEQSADQVADLLADQLAALDSLRAQTVDAASGAAASGPVATASAQTIADLDERRATLTLDAARLGRTLFVDPAAADVAGSGLGAAVRNGAAGLLVGLLLGAVVAYVLADRSGSVRQSDAPGEILGVPLLGEVPQLRAGDAALTTLTEMPDEQFQFVAAGLRSVLRTGVLLVTSTDAGDGRTVTAANLAAAAARDGLRVALVDADARSRGLSRLAGASDAPGLTDLAAGRADLEDVVAPVSLSRSHVLAVVPAGRSGADLPNLFRSAGMSGALRQLRVTFDLVVLDGPPALTVPDTASLAPLADGVLVVVRPSTDGRRLRDLRQRLELFPSHLLGYAFTRHEAGAEESRPVRRAA